MSGRARGVICKKLGVKEGFRVGLVNAPKGFRQELGSLPSGVNISVGNLRQPLDLILFFADSQKVLKQYFPANIPLPRNRLARPVEPYPLLQKRDDCAQDCDGTRSFVLPRSSYLFHQTNQ